MNTGNRRSRRVNPAPDTPLGKSYREEYEAAMDENERLRSSRFLAWSVLIGAVVLVGAFFGVNALHNALYPPLPSNDEQWNSAVQERYNDLLRENRELRDTNDHLESLLTEQTHQELLDRDRAFEACVEQVKASMADTTVDTLGNPLDVSDFGRQTCETELSNLGNEAFIEKFPSKG
jgi:hypothetical protein